MPAQKMQHTIAESVFWQKTARFLIITAGNCFIYFFPIIVYIYVYTGEMTMLISKVFKSGNSQAVRLPKEYRLDTDEVAINRIGNALIIIQKDDPWNLFSQGIREIGTDFPKTIKKLRLSKRRSIK